MPLDVICYYHSECFTFRKLAYRNIIHSFKINMPLSADMLQQLHFDRCFTAVNS